MRISPDDAAFACAETEENYGQVGLSKREYTAIAAMQGLLANPDCTLGPIDLAVAARQHADALLKELAKTEKHDTALTPFDCEE